MSDKCDTVPCCIPRRLENRHHWPPLVLRHFSSLDRPLQQDRLNLRLPGDYIAAEDPLLSCLFSSFPVSDTVCLELVNFLHSLFSIFIFEWFVLAGPSTTCFCLFLNSARVNKKIEKQQQRILAHINSISRHAALESDFVDQNPHRILTLISILPNQPYLNHHLQFNPLQSLQFKSLNITTKCTPPAPPNPSCP